MYIIEFVKYISLPFQFIHCALVACSAIRKFMQRFYERSYKTYVFSGVYTMLKLEIAIKYYIFEETQVILIPQNYSYFSIHHIRLYLLHTENLLVAVSKTSRMYSIERSIARPPYIPTKNREKLVLQSRSSRLAVSTAAVAARLIQDSLIPRII